MNTNHLSPREQSSARRGIFSEFFACGKHALLDKPHRIYQRSATLFWEGNDFDAVYIMHSGSAKSYLILANGEQQITQFYLPGDIIGVEGFDRQSYGCTLQFLETSSVYRIGLAELDKRLAQSPSLQRLLFKAMSHALVEEQRLHMNLCKLNVEQRLAGFLLELSKRFEQLGFSQREFNLSMSRADIANYLGMVIETVSRVLTKFQSDGIIEVTYRKIRILDFDALRQCRNTAGETRSECKKRPPGQLPQLA